MDSPEDDPSMNFEEFCELFFNSSTKLYVKPELIYLLCASFVTQRNEFSKRNHIPGGGGVNNPFSSTSATATGT